MAGGEGQNPPTPFPIKAVKEHMRGREVEPGQANTLDSLTRNIL